MNFIRYKLCPQIRTYKTENIYRSIAEEIEYIEEVEMLETGRKKSKAKSKNTVPLSKSEYETVKRQVSEKTKGNRLSSCHRQHSSPYRLTI